MSFETAAIFFITLFIFSITPGPGVFAILAKSLTEGAQPCIAMSVGMAVSDVVYLILACYGLAAIAEQWGELFTLIRIAGATYLVYLGWKLWRSRAEYIERENRLSAGKKLAGFIQGFLISASNPKVILFYIAFLPSFIDLTALETRDIVLVSILTFSGISLGLLTIAASAAWAGQYFRSEKAMKGLNRVAGSIMMSAGIYLGMR